ncbi:MAG: HEAT repeat domain-containing protein [Spirochaetaceae bacterium]
MTVLHSALHKVMTALHKRLPLNLPPLLLVATLILFAPAPLFAQEEEAAEEEEAEAEEAAEEEEAEEEEARSIIEDWRDTLRFGINSQVIELIPTLREERVEELEPDLARLLESSRNERLQREILSYYRELEHPGAQELAVELLSAYQEGSARRTEAAMRYLADVPPEEDEGREEITELLEEIIAQGGGRLAASAATSISTFGEDVGVEGIITLFEDAPSEDVRAALVLALGELGDPEAFDFLSGLAEEEGEAMVLRQYAVDSLGRLGTEEAVPVIAELLGASNSLLRAYAVSALGRFENEEASQALITALRDEFWRARVFALEGIARLELEEAIPAVIYKVRSDPEERVRLEAVAALTAFNNREVREFVEETVTNPRANSSVRLAMVDLLLDWGDTFAVSLLEEIMESAWEEENSRLLDYLSKEASLRENGAFAPLYARMLSHPNYIIRIYGARGIARNGLGRYREDLEALTEEGNHPALRQNVQRALEEL